MELIRNETPCKKCERSFNRSYAQEKYCNQCKPIVKKKRDSSYSKRNSERHKQEIARSIAYAKLINWEELRQMWRDSWS